MGSWSSDRVRGVLAGHPGWVSVGTLVFSAVLVGVLGDRSIAERAGLFATFAAAILAFTIYLLTSRDMDRLLGELEDLRESLSESLDEPQRDDPSEGSDGGGLRPPGDGSDDGSQGYGAAQPYVDELLRVMSLSTDEIGRAWKRAGQGNKPWVIEAHDGRRWSVYRGGRGKSGFTVTALDSIKSPPGP